MTHKLNINLLIRMYCDHAYSVQAICERLRYPQPLVEQAIAQYGLEHGKPRHGASGACST